jgi:hypothetical protein
MILELHKLCVHFGNLWRLGSLLPTFLDPLITLQHLLSILPTSHLGSTIYRTLLPEI